MSFNQRASPFLPANFLLQMQASHDHHHHEELQQQSHQPSRFPLLTSRQDLTGMEEMNGEDELSDDGFQAGEKKRRLNMEQVRTLEKNFELGNKLEPMRKMQLARALGLQPRQIAIWFQNRRARWKTKQLEKDFGVLKRQFEALKSENDALQAHNKKLQAEIMALKGRDQKKQEPINLNKETDQEGSYSNRSENSSEINLDISRNDPANESSINLNINQFRMPAISLTQLLHSSSCSELPKIEQGLNVPEESFCNMFCTMDDQSAFWAWSEHQRFH